VAPRPELRPDVAPRPVLSPVVPRPEERLEVAPRPEVRLEVAPRPVLRPVVPRPEVVFNPLFNEPNDELIPLNPLILEVELVEIFALIMDPMLGLERF